MISMIVAYGEDFVIGRNGDLPGWDLPADLVHFKSRTKGHPIIMGRKTYRSIGRPLPGRTNIVLTEQLQNDETGVLWAKDLSSALQMAEESPGGDEVFIIGGARVFREGLEVAERMYITTVDGAFPGDTYFPEFEKEDWDQVLLEEHKADSKNSHDFSVYRYDRKER